MKKPHVQQKTERRISAALRLVLVAVLAATEQQNGTWQKGRLLWLLPQVLFIGYAAYQSMGMFLCVALLWVLETLFLALRQDETKKTESGSVFSKTRK